MDSNKNIFNITWTNLFVIILLTIIMGFCILILIPSNNIIYEVINFGILSLPIPISNEDKMKIADGITNIMTEIRFNSQNIIRDATSGIVQFLPTDVTKEISAGIPEDKTFIDKCNHIILSSKPDSGKLNKISIPGDLPWDSKVDYCLARRGTLEDIDLNQVTIPNNPKLILY